MSALLGKLFQVGPDSSQSQQRNAETLAYLAEQNRKFRLFMDVVVEHLEQKVAAQQQALGHLAEEIGPQGWRGRSGDSFAMSPDMIQTMAEQDEQVLVENEPAKTSLAVSWREALEVETEQPPDQVGEVDHRLQENADDPVTMPPPETGEHPAVDANAEPAATTAMGTADERYLELLLPPESEPDPTQISAAAPDELETEPDQIWLESAETEVPDPTLAAVGPANPDEHYLELLAVETDLSPVQISEDTETAADSVESSPVRAGPSKISLVDLKPEEENDRPFVAQQTKKRRLAVVDWDDDETT